MTTELALAYIGATALYVAAVFFFAWVLYLICVGVDKLITFIKNHRTREVVVTVAERPYRPAEDYAFQFRSADQEEAFSLGLRVAKAQADGDHIEMIRAKYKQPSDSDNK